MLIGDIQTTHPVLSSTIGQLALHADGMRMAIFTANDLAVDESLITMAHPIRILPRPGVWLITSGRAEVVLGDRMCEVRAGDTFTTNDISTIRFRIDGTREPWQAAALTWRVPDCGDAIAHRFELAQLTRRDRPRIEAITRTLMTSPHSPDGARQIFVALVALLRSMGVGLNPLIVSDPRIADQPRASETFDVMSGVLSSLKERPALVDIEHRLGGSTSFVRRRMSALAQHYELSPWRDFLRGWRTHSAHALLSSPNATTELVAEATGFGSPVALCHAFSRAGLPSPGVVRDAARQMVR